MGIYNEFRALTTNPDALQMIEALERGEYQGKEAVRAANKVFLLSVPKSPKGKTHARYSFWGKLAEKMVWKGLAGINQDKHAAWMHEQRVKYKAHEKPCLFVSIPNLLMPRTGK